MEPKKTFVERREEIYLNNGLIDENGCEEIRAEDKHEIIARIADLIGSDAANLGIAEKILDQMKYEITKYVLHHEFCREKKHAGIHSSLILWLESKLNPDNAKSVSNFFGKYIK